MKLNIKTTNIQLTEAIGAYLKEKLSHLEKFIDAADESARADVALGLATKHHKHGEVFRAEINLHLSGLALRAAESAEDLYAAIDLVKDDMIAQVRAASKKKGTMLRRGGRAIKRMLRGLNPWRRRDRQAL